ncbi:hypothetical protein, partial [Pseudorhodoferax sp. Leaf274]|uniref:hypothetical protein n=1 Tax=Pseudorhodoferax sp. Leaf274 TaxID=1736318 RepID=UPI0012E17385
MSSIHTPAAKPHPAHTAAGLVRRWEDCLAPHDLPQWAEDAALTMRALAAQHTAPREEDGGTARAAFEARFSAEPHGLRMDRWGSRAAL